MNKQINTLIWAEFSGSIRILLDNPYVFHDFWEFQRGNLDKTQWLNRFETAKKSAARALASGNTYLLLCIVFNRLYTLRNQIIHGGATYSGSVNRDQLRDCTRLMSQLVPSIIDLMMEHPNETWGKAIYPIVKI